jgi:hypothetical protein
MTGSRPPDEGFGVPSYPCWHSATSYRQFRLFRPVGIDKTYGCHANGRHADGRHAEVTVEECCECHLLWLRYAVGSEACTKARRWARGNIGRPGAHAITPELAVQHLEQKDYAYGGSDFGEISGWRTGPMRWGF